MKSVFIEVTRMEEATWKTLRVCRKIILNGFQRNQVSDHGMDSNALGQGQVVGFSEKKIVFGFQKRQGNFLTT